MDKTRKIIVFLLFTCLMLVKVSAFHVYSHQHDDKDAIEHCDQCEIAMEAQNADFEVLADIVVCEPLQVAISKRMVLTDTDATIETSTYILFSRPPPSA